MQRSVSIIGWSTIFFSVIIIFQQFVGIFEGSLIGQLDILLKTFPQARTTLDPMGDLFVYNRIWSIYLIFYFCFILFGAIKFVQYREIGRVIMEIGCWIGIANACIDTILSYILWENMQAAFSNIMRTMGVGIGNLNPLGLITIIIGFFFWIIPSIGLIIYLRSSKLKILIIQSTANKKN